MPIEVPSDLVKAAREGGSVEIDCLLEAVWPDAYRVARAVLGNSQAAEDAAQEACITLYRTIGSLRNPEVFRSWFYRIAIRQASEIKRQRDRIADPPLQPMAHSDGFEFIDLWRALDTLPQYLREVVVLRYFEGLSSREIAAIRGTSDATVRFHLAVARRRLRPLLTDVPTPTESHEVRIHAI